MLPWTFFGVVVGVSLLVILLIYLAITPSFKDMAESVMIRVGRETAVNTHSFLDSAVKTVLLNQHLLTGLTEGRRTGSRR